MGREGTDFEMCHVIATCTFKSSHRSSCSYTRPGYLRRPCRANDRRFRPAKRPGRPQVARGLSGAKLRPREVGITELLHGRRIPSTAMRGTEHIKCDHKQHLAVSRRKNSSKEGLQQHPERMARACAVTIMNACLHELVWVLWASCEPAWRLASTTQASSGARGL